MARVPPMFTRMETLDRCIRDSILANPKRSGPARRSEGARRLRLRLATRAPASDKPGCRGQAARRQRWAVAHPRPARSRRPHRRGRAHRRVESRDDCVRNGREIAGAENKFSPYSSVVRRTQEYAMWRAAMSTDCKHGSIRVDSPHSARSPARLQRPGGALAGMLKGAEIGETNALFVGLFHGFAAQSAPQPARPGAAPLPPHAPCRGRLMQAPFSNKGR